MQPIASVEFNSAPYIPGLKVTTRPQRVVCSQEPGCTLSLLGIPAEGIPEGWVSIYLGGIRLGSIPPNNIKGIEWAKPLPEMPSDHVIVPSVIPAQKPKGAK